MSETLAHIVELLLAAPLEVFIIAVLAMILLAIVLGMVSFFWSIAKLTSAAAPPLKEALETWSDGQKRNAEREDKTLQRLDDLEKGNTTLRRELETEREKTHTMEDQLATNTGAIGGYVRLATDLEQKLNQAVAMHEQERLNWARERSEMNEAIKCLTEGIERDSKEIAELKRGRTADHQVIAELNRKLDAKEQEAADLLRVVSAIKEERENEQRQWKQQLEKANGEIEKLRKRVRELEQKDTKPLPPTTEPTALPVKEKDEDEEKGNDLENKLAA